MQDIEQAIRERAYHLWIADGRQHGNAEAHWLAAQRELSASSFESVSGVPATSSKSRKGTKRTSSKKVRAA